MKRSVAITVCVSLMLAFAGCYGKQAKKPKITLPPEVAGTWQSTGGYLDWTITLKPDGTVDSAVIPMGEIKVKPNRTTKVLMRDKSISTYKAGDCTVDYDPVSRELFVSVRMDSIHIKFADERIDGNSLDRFVGPVSADGKVWNADWMTIFDYGERFPQDPDEPSMAQPLVFQKVQVPNKK
mgnify:CR=1 FL=1